jgi:integrase
MASIRKRNNRWQAVVRWGGRPPQYGSFRTKKEAQSWATSIEDAINKDEYLPTSEAKRRTVTEMLERYRRVELPKKRDQKNTERYIDYWIKRIGKIKLAQVTRPLIVEIRDEMLADKAPATVNRYLATLRHSYRLAATDWGWTNNNPLRRVILAEPRGRVRHLSDDEIKALLTAAEESTHPHLYAMILIALTTGARRGEITGLRWRDVDLTTGRAVLQETKNNDKRTLPLVPKVVVELKKIQKVRRIDTDLIFENPNNGKRTYQRVEDSWREARAKAKLEDFRFHDLRHTFASRMAMDGRSLAEIAAALGHRTLAMVQRYAHLTDSHVQAAMEQTALKVLGDAI